jgi:hypothetical protein
LKEVSPLQTAIIIFYFSVVVIPNIGIINIRTLKIKMLKYSCYACSWAVRFETPYVVDGKHLTKWLLI